MPGQAAEETSIAACARELHALIERYATRLDPADVALVLSGELAPLVASYCHPEIVESLHAYYTSAIQKRMAKASLRH